MNLIKDAPVPCYAVPEIDECEGCLFKNPSLLTGTACLEARSAWRSRDNEHSCVPNSSIFIPATSHGVAAYQAAFDAYQINLIAKRLTK